MSGSANANPTMANVVSRHNGGGEMFHANQKSKVSFDFNNSSITKTIIIFEIN